MSNRNKKIMGGLLATAIAVGLVGCILGQFSVTASRLTVINKSDTFRGDEPYLAVVRWESGFGVPDSTRVEVRDQLRNLGKNVRPGHSVPIPASLGNVDFGQVAVVTQADIEQRHNGVGIGGVIYVALDADHGGKSLVRQRMQAVATSLRALLVENVENKDWSRLALPIALNAINSGLEQSMGSGCGLFNSRFCRFVRGRLGDDLIGQAMTVYVGIDSAYFAELTPAWRSAAALFRQEWPSCDDSVTPICSVGNHTANLDLQSSKGHYRLDVNAVYQR